MQSTAYLKIVTRVFCDESSRDVIRHEDRQQVQRQTDRKFKYTKHEIYQLGLFFVTATIES